MRQGFSFAWCYNPLGRCLCSLRSFFIAFSCRRGELPDVRGGDLSCNVGPEKFGLRGWVWCGVQMPPPELLRSFSCQGLSELRREGPVPVPDFASRRPAPEKKWQRELRDFWLLEGHLKVGVYIFREGFGPVSCRFQAPRALQSFGCGLSVHDRVSTSTWCQGEEGGITIQGLASVVGDH